MTGIINNISAIFQQSGLKGRELKTVIRDVVRQNWPDMPPWTTLEAPEIEEVQKATAGSGVAVVFQENGVRKTVLAKAGAHYKQPDAPSFMIPGGFINLTETKGSVLVPASSAPEDARVAAAREIEEEFKTADGSPLLTIDPARLKPMDTKTLLFPSGERRIVIGLMLELTMAEVATVKAHVEKLTRDPAYKAACAQQSVNDDSGKPEVDSVEIFTLDDVAEGRCNLLHKDQQSLFQVVQHHFRDSALTPRTVPTLAYQAKVKSLDELKDLVGQWRGDENARIGITSGTFDILHPGHISFLEDASHHCDRLIAIIASDRTTRRQKGSEKPYITELKRAQTIAAIGTVDAVIISDEPFHESILGALHPDILFKGADYKGQEIKGADMVGEVMLIPCAEKDFYSSSAFVRKIKAGDGDHPPVWLPS